MQYNVYVWYLCVCARASRDKPNCSYKQDFLHHIKYHLKKEQKIIVNLMYTNLAHECT